MPSGRKSSQKTLRTRTQLRIGAMRARNTRDVTLTPHRTPASGREMVIRVDVASSTVLKPPWRGDGQCQGGTRERGPLIQRSRALGTVKAMDISHVLY